jgi:predicted dehydrogenase
VFCQEPLGRNLTEVRSVVAAARRADRLLGLDLSYRFTQAGRALCGLVRSGELGDIYAVNLVFHSAHGPDKAWFYDRVQSGGGCLIDLGLHLVDLALWCLRFPEVQRVNASLLGGGRPRRAGDDGVEDYASAQLTLASGALVSLACSWRLPAGRDAVIEASFYGTRGGASLHNLGSSFHDFTCERFAGTHRQLLVSPPDDWSGHAAVDWAQRLAGGQRFDGESERFVDVAAIVDQLYASS